jgi:hypothetical protein
MKKYLFILSLVTLTGCNKYIPGQLINVHGTVSNYITGEPLADIPVLIASEEALCFMDCDNYIMDTVYSDNTGNYSYEFYSDSVSRRYYFIFALTPDGYSYSCSQMIREIESNKIDLLLKPFINVHIKLINKKNEFNAVALSNSAITYCGSDFLYDCNVPTHEHISCYGGNCDTIQHLVPDERNYIQIGLSPYIDGKWGDATNSASFYFQAGVHDTTLTFYY